MKNARENFSGWLVHKQFYREGGFSARKELSGGNLTGGGALYVGWNFHGGFPWGGGVYFIEGEPDLAALFEKQTEIMPYMKDCPSSIPYSLR